MQDGHDSRRSRCLGREVPGNACIGTEGSGHREVPDYLSAPVLVEACRHWAGFRPAVGRSATLRAVRAIVHAA